MRNNLLTWLEFRFFFIVWMLVDVLWFIINLASVGLIFGQVQAIAGWTRDQALLLVAVRSLVASFMWMFVFPSFTEFHNLIRKGELDFVLTKPVNTRFWLSTRYFEFDQILRVIVLLYVVGRFALIVNPAISLVDVANFTLFLISGLVIFYNFCFFLTTMNIWFVGIFNLENLLDSVQMVAQYPSTIFRGALKVGLAFFLPTIFIAFYPTLALLGRTDPGMYLQASVFIVATTILSQRFWDFSIRRYSSASS